mmetsp:Transcript_22359/g.66276  ORF Transcript_22359/g.66276 Transcript_22359/m.66276 type:complete len:303 (+) Transcript_22359:429-1337(+)
MPRPGEHIIHLVRPCFGTEGPAGIEPVFPPDPLLRDTPQPIVSHAVESPVHTSVASIPKSDARCSHAVPVWYREGSPASLCVRHRRRDDRGGPRPKLHHPGASHPGLAPHTPPAAAQARGLAGRSRRGGVLGRPGIDKGTRAIPPIPPAVRRRGGIGRGAGGGRPDVGGEAGVVRQGVRLGGYPCRHRLWSRRHTGRLRPVRPEPVGRSPGGLPQVLRRSLEGLQALPQAPRFFGAGLEERRRRRHGERGRLPWRHRARARHELEVHPVSAPSDLRLRAVRLQPAPGLSSLPVRTDHDPAVR